ncbi:hypothetical protein GH714_012055 [Hevea brasiliensis]|uniref:Subtilisin-like protease fibronectin type-III domain-containing protein n=1 Tax=Hevea brasiliensis TaxID=3981 RepID=A0A6A6N3D7_HEVBR|nr:hypothetical protein GH714_012055 [Hevea brasiliensis]
MSFFLNSTRSVNESDIIIGMLDTGIWPESESFLDLDSDPPQPNGKALAKNPSISLATNAGILAAFDDAIADGVDIISLSVGGWPMDSFEDSIAIGAFHSMKNGILTSNSAVPGVDILAAWFEATTVTGSKWDNRVVPFNIISGTSMSFPHESGAAAYVKSFHPTCRSMTTAAISDTDFAYGSGHINPVKAIDPGLVYDAGEIDYVKFLSGQGYNSTQLQLETGDNSTFSEETNGTVWDLNYPSFALSTQLRQPVTRIFHRTVTNVGSLSATYKAIINAPEGLNIQVQPNVLSFHYPGEKQSFVVTVETALNTTATAIFGSLTWDDGVHQARSPI